MAENIVILPDTSTIEITDSTDVTGKFVFEDGKLSFRKDATDYVRVNPTGIALTQLQGTLIVTSSLRDSTRVLINNTGTWQGPAGGAQGAIPIVARRGTWPWRAGWPGAAVHGQSARGRHLA